LSERNSSAEGYGDAGDQAARQRLDASGTQDREHRPAAED
jgi:hypothetical protein